jgi:hypothetical protein
MWGYEGEQIEDIEATVEHVKHCRPDEFLTTESYPIKGTGYYDTVVKNTSGRQCFTCSTVASMSSICSPS